MVRDLKSILAEQARAEADDRDCVSRGDTKRSRAVVEEMLARLSGELVVLSERNLIRLELPEPVLDVVRDARAIQVGPARNRQLRLVRRSLRECDWFSIRARLLRLLQSGRLPDTAADAAIGPGPGVVAEWMVRLLSQAEAALDALLTDYPDADRAHLRTLLRNVRRATPDRRARAEQRLTAAIAGIVRPRTP